MNTGRNGSFLMTWHSYFYDTAQVFLQMQRRGTFKNTYTLIWKEVSCYLKSTLPLVRCLRMRQNNFLPHSVTRAPVNILIRLDRWGRCSSRTPEPTVYTPQLSRGRRPTPTPGLSTRHSCRNLLRTSFKHFLIGVDWTFHYGFTSTKCCFWKELFSISITII